MRNQIKIEKSVKDEMILLIKNYFDKERNEDLGDLAASMILDFIIDKLAPEFYNQGVHDSYKYMSDRIEDLLGLQK
jgi:uncharacterized protein (DUF2164 family)